MRTLLKRWLWLLALPMLCQVCSAAAPSGLVTFSFDPGTVPLWDLSGTLTLEQEMIGAGGAPVLVSFSVNVTNSGSGTLTGSGTTLLNVGNDFVAANYILRGHITGGGIRPAHAVFTVSLNGDDVITGIQTPFTMTIHYSLFASTELNAFVGPARGGARFSRLGSATIHSDVTLGLPANIDGSWTLQMNVLPLNKLSGSGAVLLPSGRSLPVKLSGSYSPNSGISSVRLVGFNEGHGIAVAIRFIVSDEGSEVESLRGKIIGQTVR